LIRNKRQVHIATRLEVPELTLMDLL